MRLGPKHAMCPGVVLNGHHCQRCPQPHPAVLRKGPHQVCSRQEGGSLQTSACTQHKRPRRTRPPHPRTQSWWLQADRSQTAGKSHIWCIFPEVCPCLVGLAFAEHGLGQARCPCCVNPRPKEEHWVPFRIVFTHATRAPQALVVCAPDGWRGALHKSASHPFPQPSPHRAPPWGLGVRPTSPVTGAFRKHT